MEQFIASRKERIIFMKKLMLAFLLLALLPAYAVCATSPASYYVGKNGGDSYSCTQARSSSTPKLTIGAGLACIGTASGAGAGHIVEVAAGTYDERIIETLPKGSSWSSPFTLRAKTGNVVNINSTNGDGFATFYFSSGGNYYSIIDGFTIDGASVQNSIIYIQAASYIRLQNLELKNSNNNHVYVYVDSVGVEILNSKIHDGPMFAGGLYNHGIYFSGSNGLIEGNDIYNTAGFGVHIYADPSYPQLPSNNVVRRNAVHNFGLGRYAHGILLGSGNANVAYNNVVYHGRSKGIVSTNGATNSKIYNNTVYDIYDPANADGTGIWTTGVNDIVRNNIVFKIQTGDMINTGAGTIADHNLSGSNPLFVSNTDFRLQLGSPAIDAGVIIPGIHCPQVGPSLLADGSFCVEWSGKAPDIGACEFVPSGPNLLPPPSNLIVQ